jgi:hypothetical protein
MSSEHSWDLVAANNHQPRAVGRTGQSKIYIEIMQRKYGWIGHTLRKSQNEICHIALEWNPQGRRSRGRPKATWRRTVLAECGKTSFGESMSYGYKVKYHNNRGRFQSEGNETWQKKLQIPSRRLIRPQNHPKLHKFLLQSIHQNYYKFLIHMFNPFYILKVGIDYNYNSCILM